MKAMSTIKRGLLSMMILACVIAAGSISALANSRKPPVVRVSYAGETHTGLCCSDWNDETIRIDEPSKPVPIVVTWSTDYQATGPFFVGLRLNNGPCTTYGPANIPTFIPEDGFTFSSRTFQWVIMPGDYKLTRGVNTIKLCGGAILSDTDTLTLGPYTLTAARLEE